MAINRRSFMKGALFLAAGGALPSPLTRRARAAVDGPITLFSTVSLSGTFAQYGKFGEMGTKLAVATAGKVLGRDVAMLTIDTEGNPGKAVRKVKEAIEGRSGRFFNGATLSSEGLAMGKEVAKVGGIYFTPVGADEVTGSECNRSTFRWSVATYGAIQQTVRPMIEAHPKAKRWYTITPEYVFGEALLTNAKAVFKEKGIEHVGNSYHSLQEKEFSGLLTTAAAQSPDVLLLLNFGEQSSEALRQAVSFGLNKKAIILMAWTAGLEQFRSLGSNNLEGVYLGAQYWHTVSAPGSARLVKLCREKFGINPPYPLAADYIGAKLILDTIAAVGTDDPATVIKRLEGLTYEGPTGTEEIRAFDHQVVKDYYLMRGKAASAMKDKDDFAEIVSSGRSFLTQAASACKMK
jgi:branched-chain amino acid transport system substrate-binding protein